MANTELINSQIENILKKQEVVDYYTSAIGDGLPKFFFSAPTGIQSKDYSQILVGLDLDKSSKFRTNGEFVNYIQNKLDKNIVGAKIIVSELENGQPIGNPIKVRISGENYDDIVQASNTIKDILAKIEGTMNVSSDNVDKKYEYLVDVDKEVASALGITQADIQKQLNIALKGIKASVYLKSGNEYNIFVKGTVNSQADLLNLKIKSSITQKIMLKQFSKIRLVTSTPQIKKYNKDVTLTVTGDVNNGYNSVSIEDELRSKLNKIDFGNIKINMMERGQILQNFGDIGILAVFAILIIYLIIMIQFSSLLQPLIVMVTIPLSSIGSIIGLYIFNIPLSFPALFGIVSLIGIVVNNAIILVDYINTERKNGVLLKEACQTAAYKRFRPVMLTTATTVIGLIPLAISGSSMFTPMAIALMCGLLFSTLLTLVLIPVIFNSIIGLRKSQKISII